MKKYLSLVLLLLLASNSLASQENEDLQVNQYSNNFWNTWGDGKGEISAYSLEFPRYGELKKGTIISIFVTENFSKKLGVKANAGKHPAEDIKPVMKLNLVKDFQTGIYDYNIMTSSFIATEALGKRPIGSPIKTSYSSQEWCGHIYAQRRFEENSINTVSHSYFDGEADSTEKLDYPKNALVEDNLPLWARGLAYPFLKPGETKKVNILTSMETMRLKHQDAAWQNAELSLSKETKTKKVKAGTFTVRTAKVSKQDGSWWAFEVESKTPYKIISWRNSEGLKAEILGSSREKYWSLKNNGDKSYLKKLGL